MIRKLNASDKEDVLRFCYMRERENLFVIGSFENYKNTFESNTLYGYFENNELVGLAVFFTRFGNLVIHSQEREIIEALLDYALGEGVRVQCVAAFKKYADITIARIRRQHGLEPRECGQQIVYLLRKEDFQRSSNTGVQKASSEDLDALTSFVTGKPLEDITAEDRQRVFPSQEFFFQYEGKIVSKANIHGKSKHYFQIGGVLTLKEHRRKGYAKKVLNTLCQYYFDTGMRPYNKLCLRGR